MKTIAIIASCDTKYKEVFYMRDLLEKFSCKPLVIDMAFGLGPSQGADISREEVVSSAGLEWDGIKEKTKGELLTIMMDAVKAKVLSLYNAKKIDGILAVGGVQNTNVAVTAMQALPIGFPKVIATTIASGSRQFQSVVGDKDIVVIPSISDFSGLNTMTRCIIANAVSCAAGMAQYSGQILQKPKRPLIGLSFMGITNTATAAVIDELEKYGVETIGFHSTGTGGRIMEQLAGDGILDGILDLTTHEITAEYFGGGFSYGAIDRMIKPLEAEIPMVVSVGGLDFIDYAKSQFPYPFENRKYNMHNNELAHIKILPDEAGKIGRIFASRLNRSPREITVLLPTNGMRLNTQEGESLYDKEVDTILLETIKENAGPNVIIKTIEGNLNEKPWGREAAGEMIKVLHKRGILPPGGTAS